MCCLSSSSSCNSKAQLVLPTLAASSDLASFEEDKLPRVRVYQCVYVFVFCPPVCLPVHLSVSLPHCVFNFIVGRQVQTVGTLFIQGKLFMELSLGNYYRR